MPGTLFVVATPIGNLEDLTFRALRTLKEVDLVAAEDTRRTRGLLTHYGVSKPLVSLHEHNEHREAPRLVARLQAGESVAVVSDAGTPGLSDPGAHLVRLAREAGIVVVPIPGASSITAAWSVSGFELDTFVFLGFPPGSGQARQDWLDDLAGQPRAAIFLEAPHRIRRTLEDISGLVKRQILVAREVTKAHEEFVIYQNDVGFQNLVRSYGEFVAIVAPKSRESASQTDETKNDVGVRVFGHLTDHESIEELVALEAASVASGIPVKKLRNLVKKARFALRRQAENR